MPTHKIFVAGKPHELSVRPDRLDLRDRMYAPPLRPIAPEFPSSAQIEQFLPFYKNMILDQGKEGACTGFGLAAVINYQFWFRDVIAPMLGSTAPRDMPGYLDKALKSRSAQDNKVSAQMLYHMARLYDEWDGDDYEGSSCRGAMRGWHHHGVCLDHIWPKTVKGHEVAPTWAEDAATRPLGAYYRIAVKSISDMQAALQEVHAIYVSAKVHTGWDVGQKLKSVPEIAWSATSAPWGGHAFAIVGYNARGFYVQNSWGADWGFEGFALLTYEDWLDNAMDAWAVVYGAPIEGAVSPVGMHRSGSADHRNSLATAVACSAQAGQGVQRHWCGSEAYQHSIVLGNNGRPISRLVQAETGAEHVLIAAKQQVLAWCEQNAQNRNLMIYAHGGLNNERASMRRIAVLGPVFKANGIYPLFVTWKTGIVETLVNLMRDAFSREEQLPDVAAEFGLRDWVDDIADHVAEANDYTWEAVASRFVVRSAWSEMKENAALAANQGGGTFLMAEHLEDVRARYPDLNIHLVGHSAGSLVHGHVLDECARRSIKVQSLNLFAPACTLDFARKFLAKAFDKGVLDKDRVLFELLSERNERDDHVAGVYRKSLLYLVSRALETEHKTPLLGLQSAWDQTGAYRADTFPRDGQNPSIRKWTAFWGDTPAPHIVWDSEVLTATAQAAGGQQMIKSSHGSFDNSIDTLTRSIRLMTGQDPQHPIADLTGF